LDGIPFFVGALEANETGLITFSDVGPGIVSDGMHVHISDDEVRHTISGTLNVNPRLAHNIYTFNPVFQTLDDRVYISLGGSSVSVSRDDWESAAEGPVQSFRKEQTLTTTVNGVSNTRIASVSLGIAIKHPPERIVILHMDAQSRVLTRDEYAPEDVPETIRPTAGTAYLIIETHRNPAVQNPVQRELYGTGDGAVKTFYERENGVVNRRFSQVKWE
jgi:hypothetical protein